MRIRRHQESTTPRALTYSLLVHGLVLAALLVSFHFSWRSRLYSFHTSSHPVVGELVNPPDLTATRAAIAKERAKEIAQAAQAAAAQAAAQAKAQAAAQAKAQAKAQAQAQAKVQAQAKAEAAAKAEAKAARLEALRKELSQSQVAAQSQARRASALKDLSDRLKADSSQGAPAAALTQATADRELAAIQRKVSLNWVRPPGSDESLECVVAVRVLPAGDVISVLVTKSSGNAAFDRSVQEAVYRASPLPLPSDPVAASAFHHITFTFHPESN